MRHCTAWKPSRALAVGHPNSRSHSLKFIQSRFRVKRNLAGKTLERSSKLLFTVQIHEALNRLVYLVQTDRISYLQARFHY
jgi:hypothetical protein